MISKQVLEQRMRGGDFRPDHQSDSTSPGDHDSNIMNPSRSLVPQDRQDHESRLTPAGALDRIRRPLIWRPQRRGLHLFQKRP